MLRGVSFGINLCWGGWSSRIVAVVGEILGILLLYFLLLNESIEFGLCFSWAGIVIGCRIFCGCRI